MSARNGLRRIAQAESARYHRYSRSHLHFTRNIIIDAFLSVAIVILGYAFATQSSASHRVDQLRNSGGVAMTATELIDHVKKEKIAAYWFGPIPENKYTIICTDRDEILISYIPSGATLHASSESNILIETYSSSLNGEGPLASPVAKDADDILAMQNESGRGNVEPIIHPRYSIEGTERVVEVHYPTVDASLNEKFGQANLKLIQ